MTLRFGTDGVRGVANAELTPELVLALGRAAGRVLGADSGRFVIGRDTRRSGPLLEAALAAGLAAEGVSVERLGVLPTPGVAFVAASEDVPGAVISASHNAYADNGIKLFAAGGLKLDDPTEDHLEAELDRMLHDGHGGSGAAVGDIVERPRAAAAYVESLVASLEGRRLDGLSVVVDCANGAASALGPEILRRLGAKVVVLSAEPDGVNINEGCGSTHPAALQEAVQANGADAGLAYDGDADRVVAVAANGDLVDGDHLIAILAVDLLAHGRLRDHTVVVTVMTNLGFRLAMAQHGIEVVVTDVGDRHVLGALAGGGWSLGGEQSGHVIFPDQATTGDGILTGLHVLDAICRSSRSLSELAGVMHRLPQILRNVRVSGGATDVVAAVADEAAAVEASLAGKGRVLLRPSGTEPLVRVMVEAPTQADAETAAGRLVRALEAASAAKAGG